MTGKVFAYWFLGFNKHILYIMKILLVFKRLFLVLVFFAPIALLGQSTIFSIDVSADDYSEETVSDGSIYSGSSDLELCYDDYNGGQQVVGLHFSGISIPQGVTVSNSYIQFQADESQSGTGFTITIEANDVDNASSLSGTDYDVSGRTSTTASVTWSPSAWTAGDETGDQKTPSLNSIIQELVNRAGWAGSNLVIMISANSGSNTDHRTATNDPVLHIEYSANTEDVLYYVSDQNNDLYKIDIPNENNVSIGDNVATDIEGIANWPSQGGYKLYAADGGRLGTLSFSTGVYSNIGEIDNGGTADGSDGAQSLNDVDGLSFNPRTRKLWASNRRGGDYDILFQIDPSTGHFVPDVFGSGVDYVVIDGSGVYQTFDDIAVSPIDGKIFGVSNDGTSDQLVQINPLTGAIVVNTAITGAADIEGLAFTNSGILYGSSGTSDEIFTLNTSTGAATKASDLLGGDVEGLAALVEAANIVSGTLWSDTDTDGIKDGGENTGISGVTIELWDDVNNNNEVDAGDKFLQSTTTDASGNYSFEFASTGHLAVKVKTSTLPAGYALTTDNKESADFTNFDNTDSGNNFGAYTGADCDGDGIPDFSEGDGDTDGDGVDDKCDLDSDNDGIIDSEEGDGDTDGDGIKDYLDLDSDNDGIPDAIEANGGTAPSGYSSATGRIGGSDSDGDGIMNSVDGGSTSTLVNYDTDGDGYKDYKDLDSDNDGILDLVEAGGTDSNGDGRVDSFSDSNSDGYHDAYATTALPIPNTDSGTEAVTLPNYRDIDSDGDSIDDTREGYSPAGYKLISVIQDNDGDGILNQYDNNSSGTSITPYDYDSDGTPDYLDLDSDNDGAADIEEGNNADSDGGADSSPSGSDDDKNGMDDAFDLSCTGASGSSSFTASSRSEERNSNGNTDVTGSSDIELTYESYQQTVGIRFTNVSIEQGVTISKANIQFQADEATSGALTITIKGEDVDNSAVLTEGSGTYNVSGRTTTSASVSWSPADWTTVGDEGAAQRTTELKTIIQEIVNRAGWSSGNALTIIITSSATNRRIAENTPVLSITTSDGLKYDCGSDIALQDYNSNSKQDWRDVDAVLPVSLISFNADYIDNAVQIDWITASEENNDYFIVQKSTDGIYFEDIDRVEGAGNSNVIVHYQSFDENPDNINYYRLLQVDFDGQNSLSNIIVVRNNNDKEMLFYPNPSTGIVNIETENAVDVIIYSSIGQTVAQYHFEASSLNEIDLSNEPKGIYFVSYYSANKLIVKKVMIE